MVRAHLPYLRDVRVHVNLATEPWRKIWENWYSRRFPPKLEVDLILILGESGRVFEKASIIAVECKYFQGETQRFFVGIQQALAYSLLGFDGLSLWHIFSEKTERHLIPTKSTPVLQILGGFDLPVFYAAFKTEKSGVNIVCPNGLGQSGVSELAAETRAFFSGGRNRNPLLSHSDIIKRRNVLKVLLGIPAE